MIDIFNGAQKALFNRLTAQLSTQVVEQADQNLRPPFVSISDITSEPAGGKAAGLDRLTITIQVEAKAAGRKAAQTLGAQVRTALEGWGGATVDGVLLSAPTFQSEDYFRLDENERHFGQVRFLAFAQPV